MKLNELEQIINDAFNSKQNISDKSDKKIIDAINQTIELTDKGDLRVAERKMVNGLLINGLRKRFY